MQNVTGSDFSLAHVSARAARGFSLGLLAIAALAGSHAAEEQSPRSAPLPTEIKAEAEAMLLANPLKRPKEKVPHITYHRKNYYYC